MAEERKWGRIGVRNTMQGRGWPCHSPLGSIAYIVRLLTSVLLEQSEAPASKSTTHFVSSPVLTIRFVLFWSAGVTQLTIAEVRLVRLSSDELDTRGVLLLDGKPFCWTLELPFRGNVVNISCIPVGTFTLKPDDTGKHKFFKVIGVPDRTDIEIHPGNFVTQLNGCIALGQLIFKHGLDMSVGACNALKSRVTEPTRFIVESYY